MATRHLVFLGLVTAIVAGVALGVDVLTDSDEDLVTRLADDLVADPASSQLEWTDPDRVPVAVQIDGRPGTLSTAFGAFAGDDVELVQRSVTIDGDEATLAVRARVDGELRGARFRLVRDAERGWLVSRVVGS